VSRYDTVVNLANPNTSQTLTALLVGEGKNVLDVGCATGYLADVLNARGCTVSGFEMDPEAAEIARPKLDRLVVADLETTPLTEAFAGSSFDRIVFADVLEHLRDPTEVLRSALGILAPDGEVIVSIPNVAHGALRLALLGGRWRYTERGLLDRTHLRFFTLEGVVELLSSAGLVVREAWSTTVDVLATEVEVAPATLPDEIVEWVRGQPRALDYQFVMSAGRGRPTGRLPEVRQAVVAQDVRPDDGRPSGAQEGAQQRSQNLTLEDQLSRLQADRDQLRFALDATRASAEQLGSELRKATGQRDRLLRSRSYRLGRTLTAPLRAVRRRLPQRGIRRSG
jgi:2-polyprenyl-3-methyl-5-hydroxy-6-metoxy-1,4-benzoquinol methylase